MALLFTYGNLSEASEQMKLLGHTVPTTDVVITGFTKINVKQKDGTCPQIIESKDGKVSGKLLELNEDDLKILDASEKPYGFSRTEALLTDGRKVWIYTKQETAES